MTLPRPVIVAPYLITSRRYPTDPTQLQNELSKSWIDTANAVNILQIGIYDKFQTNTGQRWFATGDPVDTRQAFRQVYSFPIASGTTTTIPHNIPVDVNTQFTHIYGVINGYSGPYIPLPAVDVIDPNGNTELYCDNINLY